MKKRHCILNSLALKYQTDKWNCHWYTPHYHHHFKDRRKRKLKVLEIGVGGYEDPLRGGNSLRMWREYFPASMIYGLDIHDKKAIEDEKIKIFQGSQTDKELLEQICKEHGPFDIVIDDGSHVNEHVITTFKILFPLLRDDGIYVVEDTQTSYWPYMGFGGDSADLMNPKTMMNFFKSLTDCLNHSERILPGYEKNYFDSHITSIHFYHNLVFVDKGLNDEGSNIVKSNSIAHIDPLLLEPQQ